VLSMPNEQATSTAQINQVQVKAVTPSGEEIEIARQSARRHSARGRHQLSSHDGKFIGTLGIARTTVTGADFGFERHSEEYRNSGFGSVHTDSG
jgi:hypothetical protein